MRLGTLFLCLSLLLATSVRAEEVDDSFFRDYFGLCNLLESHGIEPVSVNWAAIEPACLGLKTETDQVLYNRCLYEKALDGADFPADSNSCNAKARADFPDALLSGQPQITITKQSGVTNIYQPALSGADLNTKRDAAYDECMSSKGWRDPNNALRGRVSHH